MEVLLPNAEIMEGLYFLANAAKNIGDLFFFIPPGARGPGGSPRAPGPPGGPPGGARPPPPRGVW